MSGNGPKATTLEAAVADSDLLTTQWHALDIQATLDKLGSTSKGLQSSEAKDRLEHFGPIICARRIAVVR